jgi:glycoside/pentoside/hexuronide:cation symporter, GPH family
MSVASDKVGFGERIGYGFGDLASCLFWQTFTVFLIFFYTDVFGISAAAVGTMTGVVRIIDLVADPVMGMIGDRTHTRWGKFRPYLLWMALPFGLIGFLTFFSPDLSPSGKLVYAYATYGAMMLVYTAINIPYGALMGVITPDSLVRTRLSSYRFLGAFTGNFIVQVCTVGLVRYLGGGSDRLGYRYTIAIYAASATLLFLGTFALTRERVVPRPDQETNFGRDLLDLLHNGPWLILCIVGICANTWAVLKMSSLLYYFKYFIANVDATAVSWFMGVGTAANILGVLATGWMTKKLGKKTLYMVMMSLAAVTTVAVIFLTQEHFKQMLTYDFGQLGGFPLHLTISRGLLLLYLLNIVGGFASGPVSPLIWALYADTADYSEWKTGRRATGLVFSAGTFAQKMGWTIGGSLAAYLLAFYGFKANVAQEAASLGGIRLLQSVIPTAAALLAIAAISFYAITEKLQKQISADLAERRAKV